nr:hypothetical protein [Tanacetum cinerariifolium]
VLDLVDYSSSSDSDPSEDSLPVAPGLPLVSPFLCSDDSEPAILVRPGEAIPIGRPYRTHPNRPRKLLIARKRVGPFLARRLAWRRVSHHSLDHHSSLDFTLDLSSSSSSSDSSIFIFIIRFIKSSFLRFALLSTLYPPMTSESSPDSSSERSLDLSSPSAGPSPPALADLLPRKRFRDSYSSEVSGEEHIQMGTADAKTVADLGICERVGAHTKDGIDLGVEVASSDVREDEEEFKAEASDRGTMKIAVDPLATSDIYEPTGEDSPDLEGALYDMITEFETAQRQLEAGQLVASGERAGLADRVMSLGRKNLRVRALLCIERDRVDSLHRHMPLSQEEFRQVHRDRDDTRRRLRKLESLVERRFGFRR